MDDQITTEMFMLEQHPTDPILIYLQKKITNHVLQCNTLSKIHNLKLYTTQNPKLGWTPAAGHKDLYIQHRTFLACILSKMNLPVYLFDVHGCQP